MGRTSWDTWHFSWSVRFSKHTQLRSEAECTAVGVGAQHRAVFVLKGQSRRGTGRAGWSPAAHGPDCQIVETGFVLRKEGGERQLFRSGQSRLAAGGWICGESLEQREWGLCLCDHAGSLLITPLCGWTEHGSDPSLKPRHSLNDSWVRWKDF